MNRMGDISPLSAAARRRRGVTLLELLIVLVMTALLAAALAYAFTAELTLQRRQDAHRATIRRTDAVEQAITNLLQGARLSSMPSNPATYFLGIADSNAGRLGCDRLTFTTTAPGVPMAALYSTDDFETQQQARGPIGGLAEVSLATTPVGEANGQTGLFERMQRPSDADPTQGGLERVLDPEIAEIGFLFWDGQQWVPTWDTTTSARRLPQAVEVRYTLQGDPNSTVQMFVVPIPASDVSAQDPAAQGGAS